MAQQPFANRLIEIIAKHHSVALFLIGGIAIGVVAVAVVVIVISGGGRRSRCCCSCRRCAVEEAKVLMRAVKAHRLKAALEGKVDRRRE